VLPSLILNAIKNIPAPQKTSKEIRLKIVRKHSGKAKLKTFNELFRSTRATASSAASRKLRSHYSSR
jgi:hypothetical protein